MLRSYPRNSITKDILQEQLQRLKEKKSLTNPDVIRLLQSARHTGAVIPFSPFRKMVLRSNIFAIISEIGWPAFFITLNPNDLSSFHRLSLSCKTSLGFPPVNWRKCLMICLRKQPPSMTGLHFQKAEMDQTQSPAPSTFTVLLGYSLKFFWDTTSKLIVLSRLCSVR